MNMGGEGEEAIPSKLFSEEEEGKDNELKSAVKLNFEVKKVEMMPATNSKSSSAKPSSKIILNKNSSRLN